MDTTFIRLSRPFFDRHDALCFSAYAFGWGYCAFSLDPTVADEALGRAGQSARQRRVGFAVSRARIRDAVRRAVRRGCGERVALDVDDFR
ncbi:hypothetical protein [Paraburkholderia antibiotica]|uniref:DUF1488 domain-containing protein n=1 Tax=Paraburkholderia antibiotica TaxID=2728839 RepID=A0A7X9X3T2_9BURK|nr:hypothetical protein [Paraburkholderia antibiotica]NML30537.1 hypothetical protein [Paraburkholderia antibiotica]